MAEHFHDKLQPEVVIELPNNAPIKGVARFNNSRTWPMYPWLPVVSKLVKAEEGWNILGVCTFDPKNPDQVLPTVFQVNLYDAKHPRDMWDDPDVRKYHYDSIEELAEEWRID